MYTLSLLQSAALVANSLVQNLAHYDHSVLKAFSPYFAGHYLVRNRTEGWKSLGGILLAFTGAEALFADLGAFSRRHVSFPSSAIRKPFS